MLKIISSSLILLTVFFTKQKFIVAVCKATLQCYLSNANLTLAFILAKLGPKLSENQFVHISPETMFSNHGLILLY